MWYGTLSMYTWTSLVASSFAFLVFSIYKRCSTWKKLTYSKNRKREMSASELFYHHTFLKAKSLVSFVTVLESKVTMKEAEVERALELLSRRHPFLRMTIEEVNDGQEKRFFYKEMETFTIDLRTSNFKAKVESDWQLAFSSELLQPMNCEEGPLWRVCQLKECVNGNGTVINCFIWTFHHSIIDGYSVAMIVDEFLVLLHRQNRGDLSDNTEVEEEQRYDLLPSCETAIEDQLKLGFMGRLKLEFNVRLQAWNMRCTRGKTDVVQDFFAKFPISARESDDCTVGETKAVFVTFNNNDTEKLVMACRQRGCTVHGVLTAAASMAIAELLQDGEVENEWVIPSSCVVNVRKHCENVNNDDNIGLFVGLVPFNCIVPAFNDSSVSQVLWSTAQECTANLKAKLASKCHIHDFKRLHNIGSPSLICGFYEGDVLQNYAGRYRGSYFSISNMGRYNSTLTHDSTYRISRMFFGYGEHIKGPLFVNNFVSVNGQLCWTALYFSTVTETNIADEYRSRILAKLHLAMQDV